MSGLTIEQHNWEGELILTCMIPNSQDWFSKVILQLEKEKDKFRFSHQIGGRWENTYLSIDLVPDVKFAMSLAREIAKEKWNLSICALYESLPNSYDSNLPFWFNIAEVDERTGIHDHAKLASISGVLYLQCDDKSGNLFFRKENKKDFQIVPKIGKLVLFRSHLRHGVHANNSNRKRISLAFNLFPFPLPCEEW